MQAFVEHIQKKQHKLATHISLPCTTSALRTYTYENKHTPHFLLHYKDCESVKMYVGSEQRLMANEHPQFDGVVPQFRGKINEKFIDWETSVRLWAAEHKGETKLRLGPRFCRRGLFQQPIVKTKFVHWDVVNFTVCNIIQTFRIYSYGNTSRQNKSGGAGQPLRHAEAEAIPSKTTVDVRR